MTRRVDGAADLPLTRWGEQLRRDRARRCQLRRRAGLTGVGIALVAATIVMPPAPRLIWNASASAPIGLYVVTPGGALATGTMVVAWPPDAWRSLAAARHYLPLHVPLVKRIAAGPGDMVCASRSAILIDGRKVASRQAQDRLGRPMSWWSACLHLQDGQYFLLMPDAPASFDGRYFGISEQADIIGSAHPLWTR